MRSVHGVVAGMVAVAALGVAACGDSGPEARGPDVAEGTGDRCTSLARRDLIDFRITESERVPATDDTPSHCRVVGVIETEIRFELLLPDDWNGRFVMGGGGGFVGSVENQARDIFAAGGGPLERGYATVGTDTGHEGDRIEAAWALDNPERQENFGHRAVHLTAETAKSIIRHFYDEAPEYSYFVGCSRGGGQAMMESQRYPDDFDGIVAAAPAYHWTAFTAGMVQTQQAIYPTGDLAPPIITPDNLALLAEAIDTACDTLDGIDDGILTDPRACGFRPRDLPRCEGGATAGCVTSAQLAAIEAVYDGPTRNGQSFHFGFPFGGENDPGGWDTWVVGAESVRERGAPSFHYAFGTELYKHFVFGDPEWSYTEYDFSTWKEDTASIAEVLDATDTDLASFRDRGGKIIYWTGWSDLALTPLGTIDYYEQLLAGDPTADTYARLYLLPGVLHCAGGPGADQVDWLGAIRGWVEDDQAPERLLAQKLDDSGTPVLSRPACPYPQVPVYRGEGDPNVEASFVCALPE